MDSRWQRLRDFTQQVQTAAGVDEEHGLFAWEIHAQPHATAEHNFDMWSTPCLHRDLFQDLEGCLKQQIVRNPGGTMGFFFLAHILLEKINIILAQ